MLFRVKTALEDAPRSYSEPHPTRFNSYSMGPFLWMAFPLCSANLCQKMYFFKFVIVCYGNMYDISKKKKKKKKETSLCRAVESSPARLNSFFQDYHDVSRSRGNNPVINYCFLGVTSLALPTFLEKCTEMSAIMCVCVCLKLVIES